MNCQMVEASLGLFLYGELTFDEEEAVHAHLAGCTACQAALAREQALHGALDGMVVEPSASLLRECRENLRIRLAQEAVLAPAAPQRPWLAALAESFVALASVPAARWAIPLGASAMLAMGFFAARLMDASAGGAVFAGGQPLASRVRYVEPDQNGRVQIVVDEIRQRVVSGRLEDDGIRRLLLAAVKDPANPGLRAETIGILNQRAQESEFRDALVHAVKFDTNAGVRLRALAGLKLFAQDQEVRAALAEVLLRDANPGIRTQAIDLLVDGRKSAAGAADPELAGVLQQLLRQEGNTYVRRQCERALQDMKASLETY